MSDPTIGEITDTLYRVREKKRAINEKLKEADSRERQLKEMLMEALDKQDTRKGEGKLASCSISTGIVPTAQDWQKIYNFVKRHGELELFEKRLSVSRYRELLEERPRGVPGIEPFEKRTINLRKLS